MKKRYPIILAAALCLNSALPSRDAHKEIVPRLAEVCDKENVEKTLVITDTGRIEDPTYAKHSEYAQREVLVDNAKMAKLLSEEKQITHYHCHPNSNPNPSLQDTITASKYIKTAYANHSQIKFRIVSTNRSVLTQNNLEIRVIEYAPNKETYEKILHPQPEHNTIQDPFSDLNILFKSLISSTNQEFNQDVARRRDAGDKDAFYHVLYEKTEKETGWKITELLTRIEK